MKTYSEYTTKELSKLIKNKEELIYIREMGDDMYYSSCRYDSDKRDLAEMKKELQSRNAEFDEIMVGFMNPNDWKTN